MANLGKAYVSIIPKAEGITNQISSIITPATTSAGQIGGARLSQGIANGINSAGGTLTRFAATGAATIAGIAGSITTRTFGGGLSRAMQIQDAKAKMDQLGMSTKRIMKNVDTSVTGTRYGINEMAGVAVNFASSGVKAGKGMTDALKSVASVASIAGTDLTHMGAIFNKVSSAGQVTGQVITQLSMNGINATSALAKHFGKSSEDIAKMVKKGQIGFKDFSDAMYKYFGDASKSANSTFSGSLANVGAALSRIGARFTDPALSKLRDIFAGTGEETTGLILALKNVEKALQPLVDKFAEFIGVIGDKVLGAIETFNGAMKNGASVSDAFKTAVKELIPQDLLDKFNALSPGMQSFIGGVGKVAAVVAGASAGMGILSGAVGSLMPQFGMLLGPLGGAGGAFGLVSKAGNMLFGTISKLIGGGGLGGLPGILGALTGPLGIAVIAFGGIFAASENFRNAIMGLVKTIASSLMPVIQNMLPVFKQVVSTVIQIATVVGDALAPVINTLAPLIGNLISTIGTLVQEVLGAVMPALDTLIPMVQALAEYIGVRLEAILSTVITVTTKIVSVLTPIITKIVSIITRALQGIMQITTNILNRVKGVFQRVWGAVGPIVSKAIDKVKSAIEGVKSVVGKVTTTFNNVKKAMIRPIENVRDKIKSIIDKIKGFFHFTADTPKIKLPHFSISPAGWKMKDLLKGSIPKLSISWAAKGGIMNTPTLVGAGEAGKEALLPLDPFWKKLDSLKEGMGQQDVVMYNTFNITGADDPEKVVATVASKLKYAMRTA